MTLGLTGLTAAQKTLTVEFDLYLLRSWDGANTTVGPDSWKLLATDAAGTTTLLDTTFSNFPDTHPDDDSRYQNYPNAAGGATVAPFTKAVEKQSLGYYGVNGTYQMDSVYHLVFDVTVNTDWVDLKFSASGLETTFDTAGKPNESWGLDNVHVYTAAPPDLASQSCDVGLTGAAPGVSQGHAPGNTTAGGVRLVGAVNVLTPGIGSGGFGTQGWFHAPGYTNSPGATTSGFGGAGVVNGSQPYLVQVDANNTLAVVTDALSSQHFVLSGGNYQARHFRQDTLTHDTTPKTFTFTDTTGNQLEFYDFDASHTASQRGQLKSFTDNAGNVTTLSYSGGKLAEVTRTQTVGGATHTESYQYAYVSSGANAGLVESVTLRRQVNAGGWTTVRKVEYAYYVDADANGSNGDLKSVTLKDSAGATLDTTFYRYYDTDAPQTAYVPGFRHGLKYAFGAESYARLAAAGLNPATATDAQVAPYADQYFEYDGAHRVSKTVVQGAGCTVCTGGQGAYTYSYATSGNTAGYNSWATKTTVTLPDGTQEITYANAYGQTMLHVVKDGGNEWKTYFEYDSAGRLVLTANPSAVSGYSEALADLVGKVSATNYTHLNGTGLIATTAYYTSTTATGSTAGGVAGYVQNQFLQRGEAGTAVKQSEYAYFQRTAGGATVNPLASSTVYRNDNGSGGQTTSFVYTWHSGTTQVESVTATLPTVTTAQNGPNSAAVSVAYFDTYGRAAYTKDADGFINRYGYDPATSALTQVTVDVNTATATDEPAGWTTPAGGGLHLTTNLEVDALGRTTKVTRPLGTVDYTVYHDANHEMRVYVGWNATTGTATGPTFVYRADRAGSYVETLTMAATPQTSGSSPNLKPTGGEAISGVQSLTRTHTSAGGQVTASDEYFNLGGVTYATAATLGSESTTDTTTGNYFRTEYSYDNRGRLARTESPSGTVYRTVYDALGRAVSSWVGTDDVPTTGAWSPTNNTGANMTKVSELVYDGGGIGDSNLTQQTLYPGGGAVNRVSRFYFDWRNRLAARKDGSESGTEDVAANRAVYYFTYDNLGQMVQVDRYDGDGVAITDGNGDGVPDAPSASLLRRRTVSRFDEQGRAYRQEVGSINQTNGTPDANTLDTDFFYNHRGQLIKTAQPGGLVAKAVYDGAGRTTKTYVSDGGGDSGWADADDVAGDQVLEQSETQYDANGNAILTISKQRFHDATGTGELGDASSGVRARVYYSAAYFDLADRLTNVIDVGTNGGSAYTRPGTVPARSDTVLRTDYSYDAAGRLQDVTDPRGLVTRNEYFASGQVKKTIEGYVDGTPSAGDDRTTVYAYHGSGGVKTVTADLPSGGNDQMTAYVYGVGSGSDLYSNDIVGAVQHPDPTTGAASSGQQETRKVNALGQVKEFTDRNGTTHVYEFDTLGRLRQDKVTTLGAGVDGAVRRLSISYGTGGLSFALTSWNAASGGNVVNQVQLFYNGLGQLTFDYQDHSAAVNTGTSAKVGYSYSHMSGGANHSRLTSMTYPNGRVISYDYASGLDNTISRLSALKDGATTLESFNYLGLATAIARLHPEPGVDLTYLKQCAEANGEAGDQYAGLDRFGRVVDQRWLKTSTGVATDRWQYGYDRDGNALYKDNLLNNNFDELYHADGATAGYDTLNRLVEYQRGALSDANSDGVPDTVTTASRSQAYTLDAQGNFGGVNTDGTNTTRTHNSQNEITAVGSNTLTYDNNGNLTTDETGQTLQYDAWNRLVRVKDAGGTTIASYAYDYLGRRITETVSGVTKHLYYSTSWQVLEERVGSETNADVQYVWSPVYVDALVARDRDANNDNGALEERLYVQQDANYNVTALVDTTGAVVERYAYDPYGLRTFFDGSWGTRGSSSYAFTVGFQGRLHDTTTGNIESRNRWERPTIQVWLSEDPERMRGGLTNFYVAYGNNPVNFLDPLGLLPILTTLTDTPYGKWEYIGGKVKDGREYQASMYIVFTPNKKTCDCTDIRYIQAVRAIDATTGANVDVMPEKEQALINNRRGAGGWWVDSKTR